MFLKRRVDLSDRSYGEDEPIGGRSRRQVFVPTNIGTNTFVFDTVSFLSVLTLAVFLVRVFSRVIRSAVTAWRAR